MECGSFTLLGFYPHLPAVRQDDLAAYEQTQTCTMSLGLGTGNTVEAFEQMRQMFWANARPTILHLNMHAPIEHLNRDEDR
jgi:hypothetical protein